MIPFRESHTARNLLISFSAETQARTRYNFFADQARSEKYMKIAALFDQIADQEREHALRFFKFFNGGDLEIKWSFPAGVIEDTHANLLSSAALEKYVHSDMYPGFARIALEEGFQRAADTFDAISVSEKHHEKVFLTLANHIKTGTLFSREKETGWRCMGCGYLHTGREAPLKCPACVKPTGYFELLCETL